MATPTESPVLRAVWKEIKDDIAVKFGGIAPSDESAYGYHNARDRHLAGETDRGRRDYSVQLDPDLAGDTGRYYCALDLSGEDPTRAITARLRDAAAAGDRRIRCLREFYGSLDNRVVLGRTHNAPGGSWIRSTADETHLWHVHLSLFRRFATDDSVVTGLADVILGKGTRPQTDGHDAPETALGTRLLRLRPTRMKGTDVRYVQRFIGEAKCGPSDGIFGPRSESGVRWYQDMRGISVNGTVDQRTWSNMGVRTHGM
jgi:peptidoglycan hydrolase-like protein with peptidoglycan-binding domain